MLRRGMLASSEVSARGSATVTIYYFYCPAGRSIPSCARAGAYDAAYPGRGISTDFTITCTGGSS